MNPLAVSGRREGTYLRRYSDEVGESTVARLTQKKKRKRTRSGLRKDPTYL